MAAIIFDLDETLLDTSMLRTIAGPGGGGSSRCVSTRPSPTPTGARACRRRSCRPARRSSGFVVGILTDSPRWYAESLLEAFGIPYDALLTGSDGYAPKPDPSALRALAATLEWPIERCMVVGDERRRHRRRAQLGRTQHRCRLVGAPAAVVAATVARRRDRRPDRLVDALGCPAGGLPCAEAILRGTQPHWHWGSLLRLGDGSSAPGAITRSSTASSRRQALTARHSRQEGRRAAARVGELLAASAAVRWRGRPSTS